MNRLSLSNDTVQWRLTSMAENVKHQLLTYLCQRLFNLLQLDKSTDTWNETVLLCFVKYIGAGGVRDELCFVVPFGPPKLFLTP